MHTYIYLGVCRLNFGHNKTKLTTILKVDMLSMPVGAKQDDSNSKLSKRKYDLNSLYCQKDLFFIRKVNG